MGCDIHMHVEAFFAAEGSHTREWHVLTTSFKAAGTEWESEWYPWRNYRDFALLADVRNRDNAEPLSAPRGLPKDVSESLAKEAEDADWHSHSWFTLEELQGHEWPRFSNIPGLCQRLDYVSDEITWNIRDGQRRPYIGPKDVRIVFWFDN